MDERRINDFSNDASRAPTDPENRRGKDRRINRKSSLKYFLFNGRREGIRREEDRGKVFFSTAIIQNYLRQSVPF